MPLPCRSPAWRELCRHLHPPLPSDLASGAGVLSGVSPCAASISYLLLAADFAPGKAALSGVSPRAAATSFLLLAADLHSRTATLTGVSPRADAATALFLASDVASGSAALLGVCSGQLRSPGGSCKRLSAPMYSPC